MFSDAEDTVAPTPGPVEVTFDVDLTQAPPAATVIGDLADKFDFTIREDKAKHNGSVKANVAKDKQELKSDEVVAHSMEVPVNTQTQEPVNVDRSNEIIEGIFMDQMGLYASVESELQDMHQQVQKLKHSVDVSHENWIRVKQNAARKAAINRNETMELKQQVKMMNDKFKPDNSSNLNYDSGTDGYYDCLLQRM